MLLLRPITLSLKNAFFALSLYHRNLIGLSAFDIAAKKQLSPGVLEALAPDSPLVRAGQLSDFFEFLASLGGLRLSLLLLLLLLTSAIAAFLLAFPSSDLVELPSEVPPASHEEF